MPPVGLIVCDLSDLVIMLQDDKQGQPGRARRRDTKGNPFEFIQLLTSLVKRW